jgi:hypothetical protein
VADKSSVFAASGIINLENSSETFGNYVSTIEDTAMKALQGKY